MWLNLLNDPDEWYAERLKRFVDGARTAYQAQR